MGGQGLRRVIIIKPSRNPHPSHEAEVNIYFMNTKDLIGWIVFIGIISLLIFGAMNQPEYPSAPFELPDPDYAPNCCDYDYPVPVM